MYDIIIVGSGISGLYAAYNIKKHYPDTTFLVLEKHKKQWVGGRTGNEIFYGTEIVTGAGIGRKKDKKLRKLLNELDFDIHEFTSVTSYSKFVNPIDIKRALMHLREEYKKYRGPSITFEQFAKPILGETDYKRFLVSSGYTDYEKEGVYETLYNYEMEDNSGHLSAFSVHWNQMVMKMVSNIGESHFKFSTEVHSIFGTNNNTGFVVEVEHGRNYMCKKVIVATTISGIRSLFPKMTIYKEIEGQPFLRVYGKLAKTSIPIMKEFVKGRVCVTGPLQKLISIDPENGVYMIAYNDNKNALKLKNHTQNTLENREFYCNLIERSLGIPVGRIHLIGIKSFYWHIGTHYYKPLDYAKYKDRETFIEEAQHPTDGILIVGEVVSKNQGWVEGALKSVDAVLTKKWIANI